MLRLRACLYVRLKCRSDSGPVVCTPVYFTFGVVRFFLPLLWMRGSASSSPRMSASSSRERSTSSECCPSPCPAFPLPSPSTAPGARTVPGWPSPCPTPPWSLWPYRKWGMSMEGTGMVMRSLPFFPIISPFWMYLRRFSLILPRMISRNRLWSCLIFSGTRASRSQCSSQARLIKVVVRGCADQRTQPWLRIDPQDVAAACEEDRPCSHHDAAARGRGSLVMVDHRAPSARHLDADQIGGRRHGRHLASQRDLHGV